MNGFYPMLNEVHDKAVRDLPLAECALFEHLWRKLIGWNQFGDEISISQLVKETSGSRATILRLLKSLEAKRWIVVSRSVTDKVRDTNTISIPECPGIKMRLGWYQNDTTPGIDMTLGGGVKMIHTTDSSSTDSLQTVNNKPSAPLPEKKKPKYDQRRVGLRERIIKASNRDAVLPNGMTRGELLDMLEFKPAVINYGKDEHMEIVAYLSEQPRERIEWAIEQTKAENGGKGIGANGALKWIYNGVDQYDYRVNGGNVPSKSVDPEAQAVGRMTQLVAEYRSVGEDDLAYTGSTRQAIINRMASYNMWYEKVGTFGTIVGMELDEYQTLMNGGAK